MLLTEIQKNQTDRVARPNSDHISAILRKQIAQMLDISAQEVCLSSSPGEIGFDSVNYIEFASFLKREFQLDITPDLLYECHTLTELVDLLSKSLNEPSEDLTNDKQVNADQVTISSEVNVLVQEMGQAQVVPKESLGDQCWDVDILESNSSARDIAIIGIGLALPQAKTLEEFWQLLTEGKVCVTDFPTQRLSKDDPLVKTQEIASVLKGGFLEDVECFDARFFGISPREAELMDPQQRLFLQCVWHAIEDAGYRSSQLWGSKTAVLVGVSSFDYHERLCQQQGSVEPHLGTGISHAVLANRISYWLNFKGTSEAIDTACSSSLVAIHRAVELLRTQECDFALAGGVNIISSLKPYLAFAKAGMLSQTGECRPFDDSANGYVRGEGAGVLFLKPLVKAQRDGDHIYAIVKGSAVGHSGRTNSLTAPAPEAQADVILAAYKDAGVSISSLGYIEAHGTGTTLGDPIEFNGLKKTFASVEGVGKSVEHNCYVGSVKGNIGHLEAAAGIAGVLKAVQAVRHGMIPANPNFVTLNQYIHLDGSPLKIAAANLVWERHKADEGKVYPRRAGVSSFGFGGTNAHLVIEEYVSPAQPVASSLPDQTQILLLSAKSKERLRVYAETMLSFLRRQDRAETPEDKQFLVNIAYTLQRGREAFEYRLAIVADSTQQWYQSLMIFLDGKKEEQSIFYGDARYKAGYELLLDNPELSENLWLSLTQPKDYGKIAKLWVSGLQIDWDNLFPKQTGQMVIPLPGYPFASDVYWVPEPGMVKASDTEALPSEQTQEQIQLLVPRWQPQPLPQSSQSPSKQAIIVLATPQSAPLLKQLRCAYSEITWLAVEESSQCQQNAPDHYTLSFAQDHQRAWLKAKLAPWQACLTGILDLSAWSLGSSQESRADFQPLFGKIALLQALLQELLFSRKPFRLLQVTEQVQNLGGTATHLLGAELTGLFKMLGAEYKSCYAKAVDLESSLSELQKSCQIIIQEWQEYDGFTEICYRNNQRYVATLATIEPESFPQTDAGKSGTVVITGGTGGIGNAITQHLVGQGNKTFVLTGTTPLPPREEWQAWLTNEKADPIIRRKINNLIAIERQGVTLELYTGELTDYQQLSAYFKSIREKYAPITHVFHCAGCVTSEHPAFVNKPLETIISVWKPKICALDVLHRVFANDPLEAFVLFSSLSSIVPQLAVGLSDYGAANAYMNYFAAYQVAQGNLYYRTIQWTNWNAVGMGEISSEPMTKLGLVPLSPAQGLQALERILALPKVIYSVACLSCSKKLEPSQLSFVEKSAKLNSKNNSLTAIGGPNLLPNQLNNSQLETYVLKALRQIIARELRISAAEIEPEVSFDNLGVDSILLTGIIHQLDRWLNLKFDPSLLLSHNSLASLTDYLVLHHHQQLQSKLLADKSVTSIETDLTSNAKAVAKSDEQENTSNFQIAVIGIACKFPHSENKEKFWNNLVLGVDCIQEVPKSRWDVEQHYSQQLLPGKSISKWGGFISNLESIPLNSFELPGAEAGEIDPLMRLFSQSCVETILDAGYAISAVKGKNIGVFVGARSAGYGDRIKVPGKSSLLGIGQNFIAAHVSHYLNLKGPSLVVDTACSSSLMAIHLACQSLANRESEMVLAGGVEVLLNEKPYLFLSAAQALSPDGKCFTFDERANGFVPGEGVGCVLLKPLKQALADGDSIYTVIEATAANNDGQTMGVTTPSIEGQVAVIEAALAKAGLSPQKISYIETHGTGTMIGDPIELRALSQVFAEKGELRRHCGVGSVKTNIGHLLSAAGVASFIKVALSLHEKMIPASLNCEYINPRFNFANSPFYPVQKTEIWQPKQGCRRAGISSFGFGGTNVHIILAEPPESAIKPPVIKEARDSTTSLTAIGIANQQEQDDVIFSGSSLLTLEELITE